ncbi:MAG: transcriptional activator protein [Gemmatimonadetes bacterium]|nr:transcriptional activator protein [Gemmatimonadota bacterium]
MRARDKFHRARHPSVNISPERSDDGVIALFTPFPVPVSVIELSLLGTPELRRSGEASEAVLVQPRRLALLAYLASTKGALQRRDRLLLLFWGEQPESRARGSLRQALYFLRRSLGDDVLVVRGDEEVGLNTDVTRVDVTEFERAIAEGRPDAALALYRGDFLADLNIDDAPEFERWASEKRRELRRAAVSASWQLAEAALSTGARDSAVAWARRAVELADYADSEARRAMRIMATADDRSSALETYESVRERLQDDLGTVPDAATTSLAEDIRNSTWVPAPPITVIVTEAPTLEPTSKRPRLSLGAKLALGAATAACLLVAITAVRYVRAASVDSNTASRVAVLPFTVRSSRGQASYLREGMATLLGLALDGAGRLRTVDPNAVLTASPATADLSSAERVAGALGAGRFVLGEIEVAGSRISVAATLYDAAGRAQERATAAGDENHVFELVDSLARRLAITAMTDSSVRIANTAATSTQSLDAFKSFLAGETAIRSGHYRDAVVALQRAIAADSTFGLAYYRLSIAREWTDGEISSDSAAALAEHFGAHLPNRDRKLLAARRAFIRHDGAEGERLSREVLALYPTDADAWAQLGEVLFHLGPNTGRSINDARDPFLTVLRYRPNDLAARVHLTRIAAHAGDVKHLNEWSTLDAWQGDASEIGSFELAAMRAFLLGDRLARDSLVAATKRANDLTVTSTIWRLAIYAGDPEATNELATLRHSDGFATQSVIQFTEIARGRIKPLRLSDVSLTRLYASQVALMLALPSAPDLVTLARRAHDDLGNIIGTQGGRELAASLVAARVLEARYPDSLGKLSSTIALLPNETRTLSAITEAMRSLHSDPAHAFDLVAPSQLDDQSLAANVLYDVVASIRAEAQYRRKRNAEALAWLQSIGMNSGGSASGIALAARRLGEMEAAGGNHDAARRYRAAFRKMWKSSDAELRALLDATSGK